MRHEFDIKKLSLFSDEIINKRIRGMSYRAKAQSLDEKYITPWVVVPKKVFKNPNGFLADIVIYKHKAITFICKK